MKPQDRGHYLVRVYYTTGREASVWVHTRVDAVDTTGENAFVACRVGEKWYYFTADRFEVEYFPSKV